MVSMLTRQGECQSDGADPADEHEHHDDEFSSSGKLTGQAHRQADGPESRESFKNDPFEWGAFRIAQDQDAGEDGGHTDKDNRQRAL